MSAAENLAKKTSVSSACSALGIPRSNYYRHQETKNRPVRNRKIKSPLALTDDEREDVLSILNSDRFVDKSPGETYATLLDEGEYICSTRTMYRVLSAETELKERRHRR
ncbi:unnamed protein product [marine sediment metagenome]|uniref:Transposase n=1 Tax=marine sediment metagenome TaxID=412755 RepID=X1A004_9ZZZZ